jgi:hypothetical protein
MYKSYRVLPRPRALVVVASCRSCIAQSLRVRVCLHPHLSLLVPLVIHERVWHQHARATHHLQWCAIRCTAHPRGIPETNSGVAAALHASSVCSGVG